MGRFKTGEKIVRYNLGVSEEFKKKWDAFAKENKMTGSAAIEFFCGIIMETYSSKSISPIIYRAVKNTMKAVEKFDGKKKK